MNIVRVAGQIPLIPHTMQLIEDSKNIQLQIEQCLQNVDHTLDALNSCLKNTIRCVVYYNDTLCEYDTVKERFHQSWKQFEPKDNFLINRSWEPIEHFVAVSNLPRGATVEVHVYAMTNKISHVSSQKCKISGLIEY
jgi:enamine deaminase RidA (YjgF/YER057c/UK114 family)